MILTLKNGAEPLMWSVSGSAGGSGCRNYVGTVLAKWTRGVHPFVVWSMYSDDGDKWECGAGDYCDTIREASEIFANRAKTQPGHRVSWFEQIERMEQTSYEHSAE